VSERIVQLEQEEEEYFDWLQYDIKRRALLRLILQQDGTRYERKLLEVMINLFSTFKIFFKYLFFNFKHTDRRSAQN